MPENSQVFLSYAHSDAALASAVASELERAGVHVWTDSTAVQPGEDFVSAIERGIAESDALLLMITPAFLSSAESMYELGYVLSERRSSGASVIPVMVTDPGETRSPAFLRALNMLDGRGQQPRDIAAQILDCLKGPADRNPLQHAGT